MLTLTLTSDPACRTFPSAMPNAFALNIFSTAVKPWFLCEISWDGANTDFVFKPSVSHAKLCNFLPKTMP